MRRCGPFTCWTDYPMVALGDEPLKPAPIRRVRVLGYDGNKYANIQVLGTEVFDWIKCGYLYSQPGRMYAIRTVSYTHLTLPTKA